MTSLADELDFDPAFDGSNLGIHDGTSLSFDEEGQEGNSSFYQSPIRTRGGKGARRTKRGVRNSYSSDEQEQQGISQGGLGEGFSLADELGGGSDLPVVMMGQSLAEEVNEHEEIGIERSPSKGVVLDDETKARRDREYYLTSSESLNSSLRTTETFLFKLKQTSVGPVTVENGRSLPSSGSTSSLFASGSAPSDDTSTLEGRAGQIVKQMREHSNAREDQIRELQECDRILRRALEEGGDWISALANVDDLENDLSIDESNAEDDTLTFISNPQTSKYSRFQRLNSLSADVAMMHEDEEPRSADSTASFIRLPLSDLAINDQDVRASSAEWPEHAPRATICQELASLQHHTMDLVSSLGSIHEQSQVAQASMNDAARRIKSIKTVLNNYNAEIEAAEQSQSRELTGIESGSRPRDIREWTNNHMDKFQRILNDASIRAAELLSPVHDSVLDRLIAQG